ncbi:Mitochondrial cardiolipin hydrolase [Danaus plexippus plexippus]|uniref:Mitochondrial cardiolipin hydrolase n=1 Tax=Danaus plexippus plexippus TaxID=278856 RepID=A0A212F1X3_DANPL|nr:mitochondrial cardiolipin hydrolase-like [Danaus plexippus plexippus]OWR47714.1 Mitochondrial cardiolipin hydrolase [Danaus plexippus plexippus]
MFGPSLFRTLIFGSGSILSGVTEKIIKLTELVSVSPQSETINEVLFYGSEYEEKKKQLGLNNLFCIYYVIIQASFTIDVCVPSLTSDTISKCLINVQKKNKVKIRIVVHNEHGNYDCFLKSDIEVKVIKSKLKMEHEYLLIDASPEQEAIAVIGSLDYEVARVNSNRDTTIITSEPIVIEALKREFDRVWISSDT